MKVLIIFTFLFLSCIRIGNCQTEGFDFRQAKWGMSKEEVIKSEVGNSYDIEETAYNTEVQLNNIRLNELLGYSDIIYYFKNNSLSEVLMLLYLNNSDNEFNCNNILPLTNRISLVQRYYFNLLLKRGFTVQYGWNLEDDRIFIADNDYNNPMLDPNIVLAAYNRQSELNKSNYMKKPLGDLKFTFKSERSIYQFKFYNFTPRPNSVSMPCDYKVYSQIVAISVNPTSSVRKNVIKPDF